MPAQLDAQFLKGVVYLYLSEEDARSSSGTGGTGFLVNFEPAAEAGLPHTYLVTNSHCATKCDVVRVNVTTGGFDILRVQPDEWVHHPEGHDVAVTPMTDPEGFTADHIAYPSAWLLDKDKKDYFGPGDECFFVGRQYGLSGKQSNTPTVRFGAIAMMDVEPVHQLGRDYDQESLVVEARSLGGFSGSPVFVHVSWRLGRPQIPPVTYQGWSIAVSPVQEGPMCLLGIDWGHMSVRGAFAGAGGLEMPRQERDLAFNSGMMVVVPAWRITEALEAAHERLHGPLSAD
jgi:hypothetical protein